MGPEEGRQSGGYRGLHSPGLAGGAAGKAAPRRGGALCSEGWRDGRTAGGGAAPVCGHRGDQHHLQERRQDPQSPQPDSAALLGGRRGPVPPAGGHRQSSLRRAAHPGAGLPGSAGDHTGVLSPGGVRPRPHLDAPLFGVRGFFRIQHAGGVLRGSDGPHPRAGDRPVLRPAHERAAVCPGRLSAYLQLRRPLPVQTGPGGQSAGHRALLSRPGGGHPGREGADRDPGILPGGGKVPLRRPSELPAVPEPGGDGGGGGPVSRLRQKADHRSAPPGGGTGRPAGGRCEAGRAIL